MLWPVLIEAIYARVFIDVSGRSWEANNKYIISSVAIKVVQPTEEIIRIPISILWHWFVDLMLRREVGAFKSIRSIGNIRDLIPIHNCRVRAFGKVDTRKLLPLKRMEYKVICIHSYC